MKGCSLGSAAVHSVTALTEVDLFTGVHATSIHVLASVLHERATVLAQLNVTAQTFTIRCGTAQGQNDQIRAYDRDCLQLQLPMPEMPKNTAFGAQCAQPAAVHTTRHS